MEEKRRARSQLHCLTLVQPIMKREKKKEKFFPPFLGTNVERWKSDSKSLDWNYFFVIICGCLLVVDAGSVLPVKKGRLAWNRTEQTNK